MCLRILGGFFQTASKTFQSLVRLALHHVYLTSIQVDAGVRRFTLGPKIENVERLIGHSQAVDIGQQSQPRQVKMLEFFIVLKCGQCFLSRVKV